MNIICLITFKPNKIWCDFLNQFKKYEIFVIVDDNHFDLHEFRNNYNNIKFIQIDEEQCKYSGFIDVNFIIGKLISGWDKALYYFALKYNSYDYIWFIEDDVFFMNEDTIADIDMEYDDDLLTNKFTISTGTENAWLWPTVLETIKLPPPYYNAMVCACRFSNTMMECISDYAFNNNRLFFLEALFPTIAIKNNLKYSNPVELSNIHYRYPHTKENINPFYLYHDVKDLNNHIYFRN